MCIRDSFSSQAKELNAFFDVRLNALLAENADASKEKQYHLKRQILPGIAAYETCLLYTSFFMKRVGFPLRSKWTSEEYLRFLRQNGWTVRKLSLIHI